MKTIRLVFLAVLAGALLSTGRAAGANVHAILVIASNQRGASDARLAPYEPTLRRILRFESYRVGGEGASAVAVPGKSSIALGGGQVLEIETERSDGSGLRVRVRWVGGGQVLMNTGLVLRPGVPAVLGGPPSGDKGDVSAVIIVVE